MNSFHSFVLHSIAMDLRIYDGMVSLLSPDVPCVSNRTMTDLLLFVRTVDVLVESNRESDFCIEFVDFR